MTVSALRFPVAGEAVRATSARPAHYGMLRTVDRAVVGSLFTVRAEGLDRLPPAPFVLACNHHNGFDPFLVMAALPPDPAVTWFGPREDCSSHLARALVRLVGCVIPFGRRGAGLRAALDRVASVLAAGGVVGIFPEGRIAFRETALQATNPGAAAFAAEHGVPVVPCAIVGSSALWAGREISVRFGPAISPAGFREPGGQARLQRAIERGIGSLLPAAEPRLPRPPSPWLTDIFNGPEDAFRRRRILTGWQDPVRWANQRGEAAA